MIHGLLALPIIEESTIPAMSTPSEPTAKMRVILLR